MNPDELRKSWERTTVFLRDARSHISEAGKGICENPIADFEEYLEHNELELALDMLDEVVYESECESPHMIELMAKAAFSMGQVDTAKRYDDELSKWRGWQYQTKIE